MLEKKFTNEELGLELTSYINKQQNVWFKGKDVAQILGYRDTDQAIRKNVSTENKMFHLIRSKCSPVSKTGQQNNTKVKCSPVSKTGQQNGTRGGKTPPQQNDTRGKYCTFINEPGFYEFVFGSKLEFAKKFRQWVFTSVLPSIRKYGQYKMFDSPWNKMIMIGNETDLHYKVVQLIRNYYPDSILVAGPQENQDTEDKRLDSYKKGYQRGQPDLMILDYHKDYKGLCIEFKSPTNNYNVSEAQLKMKEKYRDNDYAFILSNDYDKISKLIHKYVNGVRIPCKYWCTRGFRNKEKLKIHYKVIHRIEKNI